MKERYLGKSVWLDDMINTASLYIPFITDKAVDYHEGYHGELIIDTNDGLKVSFDTFTHIFTHIPSDEQLNDETIYRTVFGRKLRRIMSIKGVTQEMLSKMTGIHRIMISRYICGNITPSIHKVYLIAKALECGVEDLL